MSGKFSFGLGRYTLREWMQMWSSLMLGRKMYERHQKNTLFTGKMERHVMLSPIKHLSCCLNGYKKTMQNH